MYQMPVGQAQPQQAYPQNYPPNAQPRRLRPKPSMYAANGTPIMPPPAPVLRATPSFYAEPMMGSPVIGQPYPMPNQQYGYAQPMPAPIYVQNTGGVYPTNRGYALHDQVDELNRYQGGRSRGYNSGPDSSLLIATLVSEQDSMYGTNMLENLTPADMDYIQSLMARGTPEHEAYRMAFDRKPHVVLPPKVRLFSYCPLYLSSVRLPALPCSPFIQRNCSKTFDYFFLSHHRFTARPRRTSAPWRMPSS